MFKTLVDKLGSKRFSMILLKVAVGYLIYLTFMWVISMRPPTFWMVWFPPAVWGVFFAVNITISIFTQGYAYKGNLIFHIAFIIVGVGVVVSSFYRFDGSLILLEGDVFLGERSSYIRHSAGEDFDRLAPKLTFKLDEISTEFWGWRMYFTGLEARIRHSATSLNKEETLLLNGGPTIEGARLKLSAYGYSPNLHFRKADMLIRKGTTALQVFPPGVEDNLEINNYKIYVTVYPDAVERGGRIENASMNIREPAFLVRIEWFGEQVFATSVRVGEELKYRDISITFEGLRPYVVIDVIKDPGEKVVFIGFIAALIGLVMRLAVSRKKREEVGAA